MLIAPVQQQLPARRSQARAVAFWIAAAIVAAVLVSSSSIGKLAATVACVVAFYRWPLDRVVLCFIGISLAAEERSTIPFGGLWVSPVQHAADFWFETVKTSVSFVPLPLSPMFLFSIGCFARVLVDRTGPSLTRRASTTSISQSFRSALVVAMAFLVGMALYGIARGGNIQQSYYQLSGIVIALMLAACAARVGTPRFTQALTSLIVTVALYRAGLAAWMYFTVLRDLDGPPPLYVTTHGDSVLWAVALSILFSRFIEVPTRHSRSMFLTAGLVLGFALVVNNRRLGWVIAATAFAYVILASHGVVRRRLARLNRYLIVPAGLYVAAALAGPERRFFAPVQALRSVVQGSDSSSQTRDIEDFNLIFTLRANLPVGTGFGHQYIEAIRGADITQGVKSTFLNYRYLPHNSVLGLMLWVGPIGLALIMLPLMLGVRSALTAHRDSRDPMVRTTAVVVLTAWVAYVLQGWGDQGLYAGSAVVLVGALAGLGAALHPTERREHRPEEPPP